MSLILIGALLVRMIEPAKSPESDDNPRGDALAYPKNKANFKSNFLHHTAPDSNLAGACEGLRHCLHPAGEVRLAPPFLMNAIRRMLNRLAGHPEKPPIIGAVLADALTYLDEAALTDLHEQVRRVEKQSIPGILIEAGCALGGSAIVIASAKARARPLRIYDVFGMIPPPSQHDGQDVIERYGVITRGESTGISGNKYYGYEENLLEKVTQNFARHGVPVGENQVQLVKGLFQDTLRVEEPVALAHIDGDWYESVMTCLQRIAPQLSRGGVLVIDDYAYWSGCRTAVDEYFRDRKAEFEFVQRSRLHILRK